MPNTQFNRSEIVTSLFLMGTPIIHVVGLQTTAKNFLTGSAVQCLWVLKVALLSLGKINMNNSSLKTNRKSMKSTKISAVSRARFLAFKKTRASTRRYYKKYSPKSTRMKMYSTLWFRSLRLLKMLSCLVFTRKWKNFTNVSKSLIKLAKMYQTKTSRKA